MPTGRAARGVPLGLVFKKSQPTILAADTHPHTLPCRGIFFRTNMTHNPPATSNWNASSTGIGERQMVAPAMPSMPVSPPSESSSECGDGGAGDGGMYGAGLRVALPRVRNGPMASA